MKIKGGGGILLMQKKLILQFIRIHGILQTPQKLI